MVGQKRQIIEYLRGLAALSVAWFHLTNGYDPTGWARTSGEWGWLGVDVFFVISGFIIPYALSGVLPVYSWSGFWRFMARRVTRIEIPYVVSIALVLALGFASAMTPGFAGEAPACDPLQIIAHVVYLVPLTGQNWLQPIYWTLMFEFIFYIFMALTFPLIGRREQAFVAVVVTFFVAALVPLGLPNPVLLFIAGFWLYRALKHGEPLAFVIVISALLMLAISGLSEFGIPKAIAGGLCAVAIAVFWRVEFKSKKLTRVLSGLGTISYSLYLVHVPVGGRLINLGERFVSGDLGEFALSTLALIVSIAFASIFWLLIERPAMNLNGRLARRGDPAAPPAGG